MFSRVIRNGVLRNRSLVYIRESTRVLPLLWVARIPETSTRFIHFGEVNGTIDGTQPNPLSKEMNPLLQQVNTVTSFEEAINLLQGYEDRTLEENLRTLMECGRYSPGVALIRSNPLYGTLSRFVNFLNNTITIEQLSSVNLYYLIRSFWSLPRIGCTYTPHTGTNGELLHGNCHLVDVLLSRIMEYSETLSSTEWSILLKSIGKLRYSGDSDLLNQIVDGIMKCKQSFTLSEMSDVAWGLMRINTESHQSESMKLNFLSDDRIYSVFKQIEELIQHDSTNLKYVRPSRLSNLVYCISYSRYPNRSAVLSSLAPAILTAIPYFSIPEIATIFTGYTESHVLIPKLNKAIIKSFLSRTSEVTSKNALSFLYSYTRSCKQVQKYTIERESIDKLIAIILGSIDELSVGNRIYLLSSFNNINYFPRESIETVLKSIRPFISNLSDDQSFSVLCTLLKTKLTSDCANEIASEFYEKYIRNYDAISTKTAVTSNFLCLFLRYSSNNHKYSKLCVDVIKHNFQMYPENYNSRALSSVIYSISHMQMPDVSFLCELLTVFTLYCSHQSSVSQYDIIYILASIKPHINNQSIQNTVTPLATSIVQWCYRNVERVTPHLISFLLMTFPLLHQPTTYLVRLFETRFQKNVNSFPLSDILLLLKASTLTPSTNPALVEFLYKRVGENLDTLSTNDLLSVIWTIASRYKNQVEIYWKAKGLLEEKQLFPAQEKNLQDIVNLYISKNKN
ncbi:hypothetical protein WA171_005422, partial [Blastocystis sp. BT1]